MFIPFFLRKRGLQKRIVAMLDTLERTQTEFPEQQQFVIQSLRDWLKEMNAHRLSRSRRGKMGGALGYGLLTFGGLVNTPLGNEIVALINDFME